MLHRLKSILLSRGGALVLASLLAASATAFLVERAAAQSSDETVETELVVEKSIEDLSMLALIGSQDERTDALDALVERGNKDIIPTLVMMLRIGGNYKPMAAALSKMTGTEIVTWRDAMLWQEAHPEIVPHESYRTIKLRFFTNIDPKFDQFFDPKYSSREKMKIRLEEITWGGVRVDGIPSLDNPTHVAAKDAKYMLDSDLVFGVEINGDVRAYPLRIMGWHEMFNEVIGGVPVALAYCTLCGAGILFETKLEDREKPLVFGSSGFLYRSNKLMFDRETNSLWNQFTGEPVAGKLVDDNIKLKIRPVTITSWEAWRKQNPDTKVLSVDTGHIRDYGSGVVYNEYFSSPDLMFPTLVRDESKVQRKDYVFGIRDFGAAKAWPVKAFSEKKIINDTMAGKNIVLVGDAATRTVRAYQRGDQTFNVASDDGFLKSETGDWKISEDVLTGPNGEELARIPGHVAYWFAWDGYLGVESELYKG
ncbi:MAG: DUF3179 domain-containing protein [Hyphomicrobiales bacterium]